jgi:hypothetical protein
MRKILLSLVALSLAAVGCGGEDSNESTAQQRGASAPPAQQSPTARNADTRPTEERRPHRRQRSEPAPKRVNTPSRREQPATAKEEREETTKSKDGSGSGESVPARKPDDGAGTVAEPARPKKDDSR